LEPPPAWPRSPSSPSCPTTTLYQRPVKCRLGKEKWSIRARGRACAAISLAALRWLLALCIGRKGYEEYMELHFCLGRLDAYLEQPWRATSAVAGSGLDDASTGVNRGHVPGSLIPPVKWLHGLGGGRRRVQGSLRGRHPVVGCLGPPQHGVHRRGLARSGVRGRPSAPPCLGSRSPDAVVPAGCKISPIYLRSRKEEAALHADTARSSVIAP
jgi:hypothetical protein